MGLTDPAQGLPEALSFLFTDIERSTALWDRDPAAMRVALELHDRIFRETAARHDGHVFYCGGDGFGIAFPTAGAAVDSALEAQIELARTDWPGAMPVRVRMGVHTGVVERRDGNYFGPTLNRTTRLADAGHGGQVLISGVSAALISPDVELVDLGSFELRGLREPERIWWLPVPGAVEDFPPLRSVGTGAMRQPPLPTRLRFDGDLAFAGRATPINRLTQAWNATGTGSAPVVLLSGEPGIGKTRLAAEAAGRMHADGAVVLYGRCNPHGGAPHEPFAEALSTLAETLDPRAARAVLASQGGELSRLIPRLGQLIPGLPPPVEGDAGGNRHRLFNAVSDALSTLAARTPGVMLVIDDFHWADPSTIGLLEHLTLVAAPAGVMIVVIHRHTDVGRNDPAELAVASLRRRSGSVVIHLGPLTLGEVEDLVIAAAGHELGDLAPVVVDLYSQTGGNPFFISELIRHLVSSRAALFDGTRWTVVDLSDVGIPPGIRELVRERLQTLGERAIEVLEGAAIFGREFDIRFLAEAQHLDRTDVIAALEPALASGVLEEIGRGRFVFAQLLVHMAVYDDLPAARRISGHVAAARAIEAIGQVEHHWPELAYHWGEAAMAGYALEAMNSALRAGEEAVLATAHDVAVDRFRAALSYFDDLLSPHEVERMDLQLRLAEALSMAGRLDEAGVEFIDVASQARRAGRADLLARAALGLGGDLPSTPPADAVAITLVEQALALHPDPSPTRALLLSRLAEWRHRVDPVATRRALVNEAVTVARATGDEELLARVMLSRVRALHGPDAMTEMLAISAEVDRIASLVPDDALAARSAQVRMNASFVLGDLGGAFQAARVVSVLSARLRQPEYERLPLMWDAFRAMYEGRFETGSAIADELAGLLGHRHSQTRVIVGASLMPQLFFQGRSDLIYEMTRDLEISYRDAMLAWHAAETGDYDRARDHLAKVGPVAGIVADSNYSFWHGIVAVSTAAYLCEDRALLAETRDAIAPWVSQHATAGLVTYFGSGHHHLGVAELGLGNHTAAVVELDQAVLAHEAIGARPFVALSQIELARALEGRNEAGDADRAAGVRAAALDTAAQLGLEAVNRRG